MRPQPTDVRHWAWALGGSRVLAKRAQAKKVLSDARARGLAVARETALLVRGAARATSDGPQLTPRKEQRKMDAPAARSAPAPPPDHANALLGVACCGADDGATIEPAAPKYSYDEVVPKDSPLCREETSLSRGEKLTTI